MMMMISNVKEKLGKWVKLSFFEHIENLNLKYFLGVFGDCVM